jgi:hypothetical protein
MRRHFSQCGRPAPRIFRSQLSCAVAMLGWTQAVGARRIWRCHRERRYLIRDVRQVVRPGAWARRCCRNTRTIRHSAVKRIGHLSLA